MYAPKAAHSQRALVARAAVQLGCTSGLSLTSSRSTVGWKCSRDSLCLSWPVYYETHRNSRIMGFRGQEGER